MDFLEMLAKKEKLLRGVPDSRSTQGIMSRGNNVYNGASLAAHKGGGVQFGRPKGPTKEAIQRRLQRK
jgi:hypothetical protein